MSDINPSMAFGYRALTIALEARQRPVTAGEIEAFSTYARDLVPDDELAMSAVSVFAADAPDDHEGAGLALFHFVCDWKDGAVRSDAERTEQLLREELPRGFDAWQREVAHG
ncbi:hypothetical protein [Limimaricola pyoseonensis]|uniref:Uncharacterized protein n=1 Tax=Limimaricola pyoseonensis TaxID=521013 RepID=A0A1G7GR65_9RHOB|nr:hypothetical protein [Limimaricola pyoseonensis]SDE90632.1 hypothetical protein SAMN04488567_2890 [Limimaricola pyoseonensis]